PDFEYAEADGAWLDFIHRRTDDAEIYFVANRENRPASVDCFFRVADRTPEIWDPVTGQVSGAAGVRRDHGRTSLRMTFEPHQAFFVVFPKVTARPDVSVVANSRELSVVRELAGPWTVKFDPAWGGPAEIEFSRLSDWTQHVDEGIRYYSGTATYVKRFDSPTVPAGPLFLDLGAVKNIAEVRLNGERLGVVWTAPWRIEITDAVKPSGNQLEIVVANLWPNRLLRDAMLPPEERLTRTNIEMDPKAALLPSGLLGPVTLRVEAASR
ncbi:MAG TPA: glycosyl hydrolase, partial [Candidatus Synoicihabitans sp.]|nr:glycosyl hydrolase [Candidatus Synoicihabitans sp.]